MIVSCPSCSAQFSVDLSALGAQGRKVKCSKCEHIWLQGPAQNAPPPDGDGPGRSEPAPAASLVATPNRSRTARSRIGGARKERRRGAGAWIALAVVIAMVGVGYWYRGEIMDTAPATTKIYMAVGLGPEPPFAGLDLIDVSWKPGKQAGGPRVLHITGKVVNRSKKVRNVPELSGILLDSKDGELHKWTFNAPESRLLPGEDVIFKTQVTNPAASAARLTIQFNLPPAR